MTFCALEAFPRTAIVTNENFFSHANLVLRRAEEIAKRCFPRGARPRMGCGPKKSMFFRKKGLPATFQFLQCALNPAFLMNIMIAVRRSFFVLFSVAALALCALAATPCPLPVNTTDSNTSASDAQSPEKEKCLKAVHHNGMIICLPCPAWEAHIRHGDADAGPCDKPGNQTPPGHS